MEFHFTAGIGQRIDDNNYGFTNNQAALREVVGFTSLLAGGLAGKKMYDAVGPIDEYLPNGQKALGARKKAWKRIKTEEEMLHGKGNHLSRSERRAARAAELADQETAANQEWLNNLVAEREGEINSILDLINGASQEDALSTIAALEADGTITPETADVIRRINFNPDNTALTQERTTNLARLLNKLIYDNFKAPLFRNRASLRGGRKGYTNSNAYKIANKLTDTGVVDIDDSALLDQFTDLNNWNGDEFNFDFSKYLKSPVLETAEETVKVPRVRRKRVSRSIIEQLNDASEETKGLLKPGENLSAEEWLYKNIRNPNGKDQFFTSPTKEVYDKACRILKNNGFNTVDEIEWTSGGRTIVVVPPNTQYFSQRWTGNAASKIIKELLAKPKGSAQIKFHSSDEYNFIAKLLDKYKFEANNNDMLTFRNGKHVIKLLNNI